MLRTHKELALKALIEPAATPKTGFAAGFFLWRKVMNIEYWRTEIDEVDREILRLLNRRARLSIKVGNLKREAGMPRLDPEREGNVIRNLQQANTGPLDQRAIAKLFGRIIRESRRAEDRTESIPSGRSRWQEHSAETVVRTSRVA